MSAKFPYSGSGLRRAKRQGISKLIICIDIVRLGHCTGQDQTEVAAKCSVQSARDRALFRTRHLKSFLAVIERLKYECRLLWAEVANTFVVEFQCIYDAPNISISSRKCFAHWHKLALPPAFRFVASQGMLSKAVSE